MTQRPTAPVPVQRGVVRDDTADVEQQVARLADLVLKWTALADRYARQAAGEPASVVKLRSAAGRGREALGSLVLAP